MRGHVPIENRNVPLFCFVPLCGRDTTLLPADEHNMVKEKPEPLHNLFRRRVLQLAAELGRLERCTDQECSLSERASEASQRTYCVLSTSALTVRQVEKHILEGIRSDPELVAAALELIHQGKPCVVSFELRGEVWRGSYDFSYAHMMSVSPESVFQSSARDDGERN